MYIMKEFQRNVLFVAFTLLAICIIILIVLMRKTKSFTPIINACPDFYSMGLEEDLAPKGKKACINGNKLGIFGGGDPGHPCNKIKIESSDLWLSAVNKKKTAKRCGITWDGITNR